jgi:hypothetical protein
MNDDIRITRTGIYCKDCSMLILCRVVGNYTWYECSLYGKSGYKIQEDDFGKPKRVINCL